MKNDLGKRLIAWIYKYGKEFSSRLPDKQRALIKSFVFRRMSWLVRPAYISYRMGYGEKGRNKPSAISMLSQVVNIDTRTETTSLDLSIAVHLHLFYEDLLNDFSKYLSNIPYSFDLFVSVKDAGAKELAKKAFKRVQKINHMDIRVVKNRGRDIAPFFVEFSDMLKKYKYISHIHSKKSLYNEGKTDGWREYLLQNLFGSKKRIKKIFSLFEEEEKVGIIYPQNYHLVPYAANTWLANRGNGYAWCHRLGIYDPPEGYFHFPAGSMFWARTDALSPLLDANIALEDFPEEKGQTDGTLAHTIERLLGIVPIAKGYELAIISNNDPDFWSPWCIEPYLARTDNYIQEKLSNRNIKAVVFDVFDTLLTRPLLNPESIKKIVASHFDPQVASIYLKYRHHAEESARAKKGRDVDTTEIFDNLEKLTGISRELCDELKRKEEYIELNIVSPRKKVLEYLSWSKQNGKKIIIASDTYNTKNQIASMLERCNVSGWDSIYVSSDVGLRKDTEELYKHILNHERIDIDETIVVGDNERSDLQIPADMGFKTLHIFRHPDLAHALPRSSKLIKYAKDTGNLDTELTMGLISQENYSDVVFTEFDTNTLYGKNPRNIGYSVVGPLLTSFSEWLYEKVTKSGYKKLYFLAREGDILKKVYDDWCIGKERQTPSEYLVVSRRAMLVATIKNKSDIQAIAQEDFYSGDLEYYLSERFGLELSTEELDEIYNSRLWHKGKKVVVQEKGIETLIPLLDTLENKILVQAKKEKHGLEEYLNEMGLNEDIQSAIVDIGYSGTIQGKLNDLLNKKIDGFYLMTSWKGRELANSQNVRVEGAIYKNVEYDNNLPILFLNNFQMEKLLSSDYPQLLYYQKTKSGSHAVYREHEKEELLSSDLRKEIREGIFRYVKKAQYIKQKIYPDFVPSLDLAITNAEEYFVNQTAEESFCIEEIAHEDHFSGRGIITSENNL